MRSDGGRVPRRGPVLKEVRHDRRTMTIAYHWLRHMFDRVERDQMMRVMSYYVSLGWLTEKAMRQLLDLARGVREPVVRRPQALPSELELPPELEMAGIQLPPMPTRTDGRSQWRMKSREHLVSLHMFSLMAGRHVDPTDIDLLQMRARDIVDKHGPMGEL